MLACSPPGVQSQDKKQQLVSISPGQNGRTQQQLDCDDGIESVLYWCVFIPILYLNRFLRPFDRLS